MNDRSRHIEFDLAKGMGIFFMVLVHVFLYYYPYECGNELVTRTVLALGRFPAAPVFMFSLGAGVIFSRHSSAKELFRRGLGLLLSSYFLVNILSYEIPSLLYAYSTGNITGPLYAKLIEDIPTILFVDILQFSGLTFMYFSLVKRQGWQDWKIAVFAVCFSFVGMILRTNVMIQSPLAQVILGLFWGTSDATAFPFSSWIIFPTAGYIFAGRGLARCQNKRKFYAVLGCISFLLYAVLSYVAIDFDIHFGNFGELCESGAYYHMSLYGNICALSFVIFWISLCYFGEKILPVWLKRILQRLSKHITPIYIVHYIFLYYLLALVGDIYQGSAFILLMLALAILFASEGIVSVLKYLRSKH